VLDIDFSRALVCWAGHASCEPDDLIGRFAVDDAYKRHERGELSDAEFFSGLRASLRDQCATHSSSRDWNAIFAGENA